MGLFSSKKSKNKKYRFKYINLFKSSDITASLILQIKIEKEVGEASSEIKASLLIWRDYIENIRILWYNRKNNLMIQEKGVR